MGVTHSFAKYTTKIWRGHRGREGGGVVGGGKDEQEHWNAPKHMKS